MLDFAGVSFSGAVEDSYIATAAVDFLRRELIRVGRFFTFETVMSHESKLRVIDEARKAGFRTHHYFVATEDPEINVTRVAQRVMLGGHDVPEDKVRSRYVRSLELLVPTISACSRSCVFDNSNDMANPESTWIAEVTDGTEMKIIPSEVPAWFDTFVFERI